MRFLPFEFEDLQNAIGSAGLDPQDFRSIKRQGKLHLFYKDNQVPFKFFRKKETRLNSDGKWEKRSIYLVYNAGKGMEVEGWKQVMEAFMIWLKEIRQDRH